jgi:hypothetical protein
MKLRVFVTDELPPKSASASPDFRLRAIGGQGEH